MPTIHRPSGRARRTVPILLVCLAMAVCAAIAAETPPAPPAAPTPAPPRDPFKDTYAAYNPDYMKHLRGHPWEVSEKMMLLSSEQYFYTLNQIHEDSRATALVTAALEKEQEGKFRDALKMYQLVIDQFPHALYRVSSFGVFVPVSQYCQRRILNFPPQDLDYYRTLYDARAKEAFDLARRKYSLIGLSEITDTMLATSHGGRSLLTLGMSALDRGHYLEALEQFEQVWDYFSDPSVRGAELAMPMSLCRKVLGQGLTGGELRGPVGHWKLDGGSGNKVRDSSEFMNDGTIADKPNWTQGKLGGALHFDRLPNYGSNCVSVPALTPMNIGVGGADFSVAFWVKWESGSYPNALFSKRGRTASEMLSLEVTRGERLRYSIATESPTWETGTTKRSAAIKSWTHVGFVKKGNEIKVFLDGKLDLRETLKAPALQNLGGVTFGQAMDGCMDDVRLYNRALPDREVAEFAGAVGAATMSASPATGEAPLTVEFEHAGGKTAAAAQYLWEFGDGEMASGPKVRHTYELGGQYMAVLTVTDASGAVSVARSNIRAKWQPKSEEFASTMGGVLAAAQSEKAPWVTQLANAPNIAMDDYTLFPPTLDPMAVKEPVWHYTLPGSRNDYYAYTQPVVTENSVIYRHKNIVYSRCVLTGEERWVNDLGGRATWQNWAEWQSPLEDVLAQDGFVFTVVSKGGPSLVALDEVTGQLKWAYGPMVASTEEEARMRFEAAPAGGPLTIYAGYVLDNIEGDTHIDTEYGLIAFESSTGRIRWRTPLCRLAPGKFAAGFATQRRNRIRSFTSPPLYHEGTVYYCTNAGAVAAVESLSGRIKWLARYPYYTGVHDSTRGFGGGHHYLYLDRTPAPTFWHNRRPLIVGERLYVAPVNTGFLFCMNRRDGRVNWTHRKASTGIGHFLGPNRKGELVLVYEGRVKYHVPDGSTSGPPIYLLDPVTGSVLWTAPDIVKLMDHAVMRHGFGIDLMWFSIGAIPFMTSDNRLYVPNFLHMGWPYYGDVQHLTCIDLNERKIVSQRLYLSGTLLGFAAGILNDPLFRWHAPTELKALEDLPHKDDKTNNRIAVLKEIIADTVPVNEHGPFTSFSRLTFERYGVPFELRFSARSIDMVYDRVAVRAALSKRTGPATDFARAGLALADSDFDLAAALLKKCIEEVASEDIDFRALVKQQLFRAHKRIACRAIRAGQPDAELENALGMIRTANTLAEEIESMFALADAFERRNDLPAAARALRSIVSNYGHHEYPIAPVALDDAARVVSVAEGVIDQFEPYATNAVYSREMQLGLALTRKGLPLYLSTVSPLPKSLTVRTGELAASRLIRLQKRSADFARAFDDLAGRELGQKGPDEQLYRLWEFPGTAVGQRILDGLLADAAKGDDAASRQRLWQLADVARISGLKVPDAWLARVSAPAHLLPPAPVILPPVERKHDLADAEGINWLVLERRDDLASHPELVFLGGRVRKRLDNKFILACHDLDTGQPVWRRESIRLKGTGQEPGFFDAVVIGDLVVVHGLYEVLAFGAKDGAPRWHFRAPFDFEIEHAVLSGDLLVLAGKTETLALYLPTRSADGEVAWQVKELGDVYIAPYFDGDRLVSVRKMPFSVTTRHRATGQLIGRLELPDLTLHRAHPLVEGGPEELPAAHDRELLVVSDGWYYIAVDTARLKVIWKRLIDQNDMTRQPALRFALSGDHLIVVKEDYDQKTIYRLLSRTGEVAWNTDPKDARSPQAMYSVIINGDAVYGIMLHPGQAVYFAGIDAKTGRSLFRQEVGGYQSKPVVALLPRVFGSYIVATIEDRQDFEVKVFDVRTGKVAATWTKKGVGPFGEHGRLSATVQHGRLVFLSKAELSL